MKGFDQHVHFRLMIEVTPFITFMHQKIVMLKIINCFAGSYISNDCFMLFMVADLDFEKDDIVIKTINTRCF